MTQKPFPRNVAGKCTLARPRRVKNKTRWAYSCFMLGRARNLEHRATLSLGPRSVVFALRF